MAEEDGVPGCSVKTLWTPSSAVRCQWTRTPGGWTAMRTWRLAILAASLAVVMAGTAFSADTVRVFRYDGSLQCGMGQAVPLDDMAKELTAVNIRVLSSEKRLVSGFIIAQCGAPNGIAKV